MNSLMDDIDGLSVELKRELAAAVALSQKAYQFGAGAEYYSAFQALPEISTTKTRLDLDQVSCECDTPLTSQQQVDLKKALMKLKPWRKGPFNLFGVEIDSEWQSNIKWNRFVDSLPSLEDKRILDIGAGNGYYLFRMAAHNPWLTLGIDPLASYGSQFLAMQRYLQVPRTHFLPLSLEQFPMLPDYFDVVFCMGVLYHRKSPFDFLNQLREYMRKDGHLVLETLTIDGEDDLVLSPAQRYAQMHNCFFLPTVPCLKNWMLRCGFEDVQVVDQSMTTTSEQRTTEWMPFKSLVDFLDPKDSTKTIEGYPAPQRSIVICKRRR